MDQPEALANSVLSLLADQKARKHYGKQHVVVP